MLYINITMPDNRRVQGPEETQCPLLHLEESEKEQKKNLVSNLSNGRLTYWYLLRYIKYGV